MSAYRLHSFVEKIARAEKHIDDLKVEVARYAACHPYIVRTGFESKQKPNVNRLQFTEYPDKTDIPLITADVIYNLRSGLDHLMAALVPKRQQRSVYFPIFFQGVWEGGIPGENNERTKERDRWRSYTKSLVPEALAILKRLQPRDGARNDDPTINFLVALNRIAVKDRHVKLPFIAPTLRDYRVTCVRSDGTVQVLVNPSLGATLQDGAILNGLPDDTVDVKIEGTPVVAVNVGDLDRHLKIPEALDEGAALIQERIIGPLLPCLCDG